jgi:hypothetical protein
MSFIIETILLPSIVTFLFKLIVLLLINKIEAYSERKIIPLYSAKIIPLRILILANTLRSTSEIKLSFNSSRK